MNFSKKIKLKIRKKNNNLQFEDESILKRSLNLKNGFFILLILMFATNPAFSAKSKYMIQIDKGKQSIVQTELFNSNEYCSINTLKDIMFPKARYFQESNSLIYKDDTIKIIPGSFFITKSNSFGNQIFQFNLPIVKKQNKIYLPFQSLIKSLAYFKYYKIESKDYKYNFATIKPVEVKPSLEKMLKDENEKSQKQNLKIEVPKPQKEETEEPKFENFVQKEEQTKEIIHPSEEYPVKGPQVEKLDYEEKCPRNVYLLPKNLKRRELKN